MTTKTTTAVLLDLAIGRSRREVYWQNKQLTWPALLDRLRETHRTAETLAEYMAQPKARQDEIKDVGGFVGGLLAGGRRKPEAVVHRQLLTLDMDAAPVGFWADFVELYADFAACVYTTHKHAPEKPRLRLIVPLDRPVNVTEYEAIGRRIAGDLGIEFFDHTGFQPYRLMYWPSTSKDAEYFFDSVEGPLLSADKVLARYQDYTDSSQWPVSAKLGAAIKRGILKQGDPHSKRGLIGVFCRLYSIGEVIEKYLGDVYEPIEPGGDRYTYRLGSTAGGLVTYEDKFAYSHHGTDPISGKLCNAFDLVRLHKFGLQDEETADTVPITKRPSYKTMMAWARGLEDVKAAVIGEKYEAAQRDFADFEDSKTENFETKLPAPAPFADTGALELHNVDRSELGLPEVPDCTGDDMQWLKTLELDEKGQAAKCTFHNIVTILRNDPQLKGRIAFNELKLMPVVLGALPWQKVDAKNPRGRGWTDRDGSDFRGYIETVYKITGAFKLKDALVSVSHENSFNPICNYLGGLQWDGQERLDRVLVEYFGAEASEYTAAVGRKWFTAAVARAFRPGCKFDYMLTLVGEEGIYKSTFFDILFDPWFTDNFSFHMLNSKQAVEQITGYWCVEAGELTGLKKAEIEAVKLFLARRKDVQRGAFKEYIAESRRVPVFAGSTNEDQFLRGANGNRRFWVVQTKVQAPLKHITQLAAERDQLWAEAVTLYELGETLYLGAELEKQARLIQEQHTEVDDRIEVIEKYLDTKVPENWDDMLIWERKAFLAGDAAFNDGTQTRERVSVAEIWTEALGCQVKDMNTINTKFIHEVMKRLPGWERYKSRTSFKLYGNQRGWRRI